MDEWAQRCFRNKISTKAIGERLGVTEQEVKDRLKELNEQEVKEAEKELEKTPDGKPAPAMPADLVHLSLAEAIDQYNQLGDKFMLFAQLMENARGEAELREILRDMIAVADRKSGEMLYDKLARLLHENYLVIPKPTAIERVEK